MIPPLPTSQRDTWRVEPVTLDPDSDLSAVLVAGGRIVGLGNKKLYTRPRGAEDFRARDLLDPSEWFHEVAIEHRAPFRVAFTTNTHVFVVEDGKEGRIASFEAPTRGYFAMHVAWGGVRGESRLYILWSDLTVMIADPATGKQRQLPFENLEAMSSDADGVVAIVSFCTPPRALVVRDDHVSFSPLQMEAADVERLPAEDVEWGPFHMANAGSTFAISLNKKQGTYVRRAEDALFRWCEPLATAHALAFEGTSPDAALFGAFEAGHFASVARVTADGSAIRLCDVPHRDEEAAADPFSSIAWDASRRQLWAVANEVGVTVLNAPDPPA